MKRKLLILTIIFLSLYFLFKYLNDGEKLLNILKQARWEYLLAAILIQIFYYLFYSKLHQKSLELFNIYWKFKEIVLLVLASIFVNLATPTGPLAGAGIFIHKGEKEKTSKIAVVAGLFVVMLFDFLTLFILLTLSIVFLLLKHDIFKYELVGYLTFFALILGIIGLLTLGVINPKILKVILKIFQILFNKIGMLFRKKYILPSRWFESKTLELSDISNTLIQNRSKYKDISLLAFLIHLSDIVTIFLLFLAFGYLIKIPVLLVGYSIGILFWIVSPTPQGVGIVESVMPLAFASLGVNIETATLVTLTFRGLSLWLPALLGFLSINTIVAKR